MKPDRQTWARFARIAHVSGRNGVVYLARDLGRQKLEMGVSIEPYPQYSHFIKHVLLPKLERFWLGEGKDAL